MQESTEPKDVPALGFHFCPIYDALIRTIDPERMVKQALLGPEQQVLDLAS